MDPLRQCAEPSPNEVRALLILDRAAGVGLVGLRALTDRFGSGEEALRAPARAVREVCRGFVPPRRQDFLDADATLAIADRMEMRVVTWAQREYPGRLLHLHDPPPLLFLRGRIDLLRRESITVVGARRATSRSRDVAERLGHALAAAGACVASGLALGIDGAAHLGALRARGDTLAVLGRGADEAYPPSHRRLFRDIVSSGLVVSEFAPCTPPLPHHFPRRNRILAALARVVVVVEAGARSGALITVDHALDLGREVWAVPGPIDLAGCLGSNRLLADGARPLLSVASFVQEVAGSHPRPQPEPAGQAARILTELRGEPLNVDEIAARLGLAPPEVLTLLTTLELDGAVRRLPGMRFGAAA